MDLEELQALVNIARNEETSLVYDTYHAYSRILAGDSTAVTDADVNFSRRARDGYYAG